MPARTLLVATAGILVVSAWIAHADAAPKDARVAPATVLQSDAARARFVVEVPRPTFLPSTALPGFERILLAGFEATGTPGQPPELSRRYIVALPPTGTYAVSARVLASEPLGTHRLEPNATPIVIQGDEEMGPTTSERVDWNEATYLAWVAPDIVTHDAPGFIRRQRVLPLAVSPVFYDVKTNDIVVATRIEIDVRFDGGASARTAPSAARDEQWNDVFGRMLVNAQQARAWRVPKPALASTATTIARAAPGAVKLRVRDTGVHKVSATTLLAAGFPAGQPVANLRMYRRTYDDATLTAGESDVPLYVREGAGGVAGVFDANDLVVFYGLRLRDDATQGDTREQYSFTNTYWLEPGAGTPMATRTPAPGFVTADTTTAFFPATAHFETDTFFRDGAPSSSNDLYYFNSGREVGPVDMPFTVGAIRPGGSLGISAELSGQFYSPPLTPARTIRLSLVNGTGETVLNAAYAIANKSRQTFTSAPIPAASVSLGTNQFRIARPPLVTRTTVEVLINFVDVSYGSLYRARGNTLRFNTATLAGDTSITVTGLSSSTDFELFDITAPTAPVRCATAFSNFTPVPGGFAFSFRENIPSRREFVLTPVARMIDIPAADVVLDTPSAIIGSPAESGVDVLVVANASYLSQMQTWATYRRAQGYRVLLVDAADVYDEFNGGVLHARAIQRFARHFFERGDASALVLVGDSSEDHKLVHSDSGPNFVPTFTRIDVVPGSPPIDEVVTTDKRFVKLPGPGGSAADDYPDMIVGRIPVGSATELDIVLSKVFDFESPDASEFWRKRMIIVADDEYSEGSAGVGTLNRYCFTPGESGFQTGQETTAQMIENSLPAGYDVIRFYLKDYTSSIYPCSNPCNTSDCMLATAVWSATRQGATERLLDELNQGATLVTIQSHMNRSTVTHERLLSTESASLLGGTGKDHTRVANFGRPWIIFGMGCHFSDYAVFREGGDLWSLSNSPNGDCFAEQFLFQNSRGAVATYGSSGFEFLQSNVSYMNTMTQVWFNEAPYDTTVNPQWKLGQLMFVVESRMVGSQPLQVERYHILGDPLLNIDAGPPSFDVTVDGRPVTNGEDVTSRGETDTLQVVAVVTDENAINDFKLEIAGVDMTDSLTVVPTTDTNYPRARQYRLSFAHKLRPENYEIVMRAYQSPDTLAGQYHIAAEFRLRVESTIEVSVNGRAVASGAAVPTKGNYRVDLSFPVFVAGSEIGVFMDDTPVVPFTLNNPSPEDSLAWIITFQKSLAAGQHTLRVTAGPSIEFNYQLVVSTDTGLADVMNYPNPFRDAGTNFMFSNEVEITDGSIDVYTVSGKRVRSLDIPASARFPGSNAVFWDGRDAAGDQLANGTYLYVIEVQQRGGSASTARGKVSKLQ